MTLYSAGIRKEETMLRLRVAVIGAVCLAAASGPVLMAQRGTPRETNSPAQAAATYFPDRFDWQHKKPEEVGMNAARLHEAVKQAIASENPATCDMLLFLATTFGAHEPLDTPIGPIQDRGPAAGLITRHGYIVAGWGDPHS